MKKIHQLYVEEVYLNMRPLRANWPLEQPIRLGDIGTLEAHRFTPLGNIEDLGIPFEVAQSPSKTHQQFSSNGTVDVRMVGSGGLRAPAASGKARLEIAFAAAGAVFFNLAGCVSSVVRDKLGLGRSVLKLYESGKWKPEWVLVSELVKSASATVAVSGSAGASLVLEAGTRKGGLDLASATASLRATVSKSVGYHVVGGRNLIPLLGLSGVNQHLFSASDFGPESRNLIETDLDPVATFEELA
jgi:hypothetical protein